MRLAVRSDGGARRLPGRTTDPTGARLGRVLLDARCVRECLDHVIVINERCIPPTPASLLCGGAPGPALSDAPCAREGHARDARRPPGRRRSDRVPPGSRRAPPSLRTASRLIGLRLTRYVESLSMDVCLQTGRGGLARRVRPLRGQWSSDDCGRTLVSAGCAHRGCPVPTEGRLVLAKDTMRACPNWSRRYARAINSSGSPTPSSRSRRLSPGLPLNSNSERDITEVAAYTGFG